MFWFISILHSFYLIEIAHLIIDKKLNHFAKSCCEIWLHFCEYYLSFTFLQQFFLQKCKYIFFYVFGPLLFWIISCWNWPYDYCQKSWLHDIAKNCCEIWLDLYENYLSLIFGTVFVAKLTKKWAYDKNYCEMWCNLCENYLSSSQPFFVHKSYFSS